MRPLGEASPSVSGAPPSTTAAPPSPPPGPVPGRSAVSPASPDRSRHAVVANEATTKACVRRILRRYHARSATLQGGFVSFRACSQRRCRRRRSADPALRSRYAGCADTRSRCTRTRCSRDACSRWPVRTRATRRRPRSATGSRSARSDHPCARPVQDRMPRRRRAHPARARRRARAPSNESQPSQWNATLASGDQRLVAVAVALAAREGDRLDQRAVLLAAARRGRTLAFDDVGVVTAPPIAGGFTAGRAGVARVSRTDALRRRGRRGPRGRRRAWRGRGIASSGAGHDEEGDDCRDDSGAGAVHRHWVPEGEVTRK